LFARERRLKRLQKGNMKAGQTEKLIEISFLPKGIYILQLVTRGV